MGLSVVYDDLSITLFVSGYLAVMEIIKPSLKPIMARHLKEMIADAKGLWVGSTVGLSCRLVATN